jgi:hypothetical protein
VYSSRRISIATTIAGTIRRWPTIMTAIGEAQPAKYGGYMIRKGTYIARHISSVIRHRQPRNRIQAAMPMDM